MAYTRTETPQDALYSLADRVPLAVVTNGSLGALAIDGTTGEEVSVPALRVPALDATGAGDVFGASLVLGHTGRLVAPRPAVVLGACARRWRSSSSAARSRPPAGATSSTGGEGSAMRADDSSYACSLRRRYAFLEEIVPQVPSGAVRRAAATIARQADVAQP